MSDSPMRCAMTGIEIRDSGDGIWDDGEWISWAYINEQIDLQENGPRPEPTVDDLWEEDTDPVSHEPDFELLNRIVAARNHFENTLDVISPDWGPIGEAYVARKFGIRLCRKPNAEGHDGRIGTEFVEIKTITPHKRRPFVQVKRAGNFSLLAIVRFNDRNEVQVRFVPRNKLPVGNGGKYAIVTWNTACRIGRERVSE